MLAKTLAASALLLLSLVVANPIASDRNLQVFNENVEERRDPDVGLTVFQLIEKYGYPLEVHQVKTADGYLLALHRIPRGLSQAKSKGPVLLVPGLLCSSADWVNMGPKRSLGFILADAGYDVWIVNPRGTTWSKKHVHLDPKRDKEKFWNFSWHEIGYYDLPASIDYVLMKTGKQKLYYIGHSQGTTSFFVMASTRPEYNKKIRLMSALAPVAFMSKIPNVFFKLLAMNLSKLEWIVKTLGLYEFLPKNAFLAEIGKLVCDENALFPKICSNFLFLIAGFDSEQLEQAKIPVIATNTPAGAATKQFIHYAQSINSKSLFRNYDYGKKENQKRYGSATPPSYDLSKVTAPVALHFGANDLLADTKDVALLKKNLNNVVLSRLVPYKRFNHLDFLWAKDVVRLVYDDVLAKMASY